MHVRDSSEGAHDSDQHERKKCRYNPYLGDSGIVLQCELRRHCDTTHVGRSDRPHEARVAALVVVIIIAGRGARSGRQTAHGKQRLAAGVVGRGRDDNGGRAEVDGPRRDGRLAHEHEQMTRICRGGQKIVNISIEK